MPLDLMAWAISSNRSHRNWFVAGGIWFNQVNIYLNHFLIGYRGSVRQQRAQSPTEYSSCHEPLSPLLAEDSFQHLVIVYHKELSAYHSSVLLPDEHCVVLLLQILGDHRSLSNRQQLPMID